MLRWCRKNARFTTAEIAAELGREEREIIAWEDGSESPSYAQLAKFAKLCKRPVAVFYLLEPPRDFTMLRDFRRLPNKDAREFSPALAYLIRICRERQEWLSSYLRSEGREPLPFVGSVTATNPVQEVGKAIRNLLGISIKDQLAVRGDDEAFRLWRKHVEAVGICVFMASRSGVASEEMRGFALADDFAPVVVVNGRERSYAAKTFTLLHEVAHIFVGAEGVSNSVLPVNPRTQDQRLEVFCNAVAAEALVPETDVRVRASAYASDPERAIKHLSVFYRVSEQVVARRMYDLSLVSRAFFEAKLLEFANRRTEDVEEPKDSPIPQPIQVVNNIGSRFSRAAVSAFYSGSINGPDLADLLNMRLQHLDGLEEKLSKAGA